MNRSCNIDICIRYIRVHRRRALLEIFLLSSLTIVIVAEVAMSGVDGVIEMMNVSFGSPISSPIMGTATLLVAPKFHSQM